MLPNDNKKSAVICPNCRKLINASNQTCPYCGIIKPVQRQKIMRVFGNSGINFVKVIITINVILFILSYLLPYLLPELKVRHSKGLLGFIPSPSNVSLYLLGWADPRQILAGKWWLLISATFLHGGIFHILFNMMWVKDLAPATEKLFNPYKMIVIYLFGGIGGNIAAIFFPLIMNSLFSLNMAMMPVIGASGAVFALMGSIIAFGKKTGGFYGQHLVRQLGVWAVIMIGMGFLIPGISNTAHIGGFISGFVIGYLIPDKNKAKYDLFFIILSLALCLLTIFTYLMILINIIDVKTNLMNVLN